MPLGWLPAAKDRWICCGKYRGKCLKEHRKSRAFNKLGIQCVTKAYVRVELLLAVAAELHHDVHCRVSTAVVHVAVANDGAAVAALPMQCWFTPTPVVQVLPFYHSVRKCQDRLDIINMKIDRVFTFPVVYLVPGMAKHIFGMAHWPASCSFLLSFSTTSDLCKLQGYKCRPVSWLGFDIFHRYPPSRNILEECIQHCCQNGYEL